jgi:hypothetical protein
MCERYCEKHRKQEPEEEYEPLTEEQHDYLQRMKMDRCREPILNNDYSGLNRVGVLDCMRIYKRILGGPPTREFVMWKSADVIEYLKEHNAEAVAKLREMGELHPCDIQRQSDLNRKTELCHIDRLSEEQLKELHEINERLGESP